VETGVGLVSEATYDAIIKAISPQLPDKPITDLNVCGIRLIKNPFIPDGKIYPFEKWDLRPKTPREFLLEKKNV